jgi:hypothetical protein
MMKGGASVPGLTVTYEIVEKIGVLSETKSGWRRELNLVSWNEREPKYDIREWAPDGSRMGKGTTFFRDEMRALRDLLNKLDLD